MLVSLGGTSTWWLHTGLCKFVQAHGRRDRLNESHFKILRTCQGKFDCSVFEMLYIKKFKPNLNVQTDSIRAKLFV